MQKKLASRFEQGQPTYRKVPIIEHRRAVQEHEDEGGHAEMMLAMQQNMRQSLREDINRASFFPSAFSLVPQVGENINSAP